MVQIQALRQLQVHVELMVLGWHPQWSFVMLLLSVHSLPVHVAGLLVPALGKSPSPTFTLIETICHYDCLHLRITVHFWWKGALVHI